MRRVMVRKMVAPTPMKLASTFPKESLLPPCYRDKLETPDKVLSAEHPTLSPILAKMRTMMTRMISMILRMPGREQK